MASMTAEQRGPEPIDWALAERIASRVAGRDPLGLSYLGSSMLRDFAEVTAEAEAAVSDLTGLRPEFKAEAVVLDRGGWVTANIGSMRRLLAPLSERASGMNYDGILAPIGRSVAGAELGLLLGYVAQRVLGQYDLMVADEGGDADAVYYVGPNILALEKRFAFRPLDFRRWIALHEVTHRAQFSGVPWLRGYFTAQVGDLLASAEPDLRRVVGAVANGVNEVLHRRNPLNERGAVGLFATPAQRVILDRMQALMSLLEGHGNAVMNRLGADMVDGQERMARVLQARRNARGATAILQRLIGLEMKMRQYEVGEAFVDGVERLAGFAAIDAAWRAPECLPTLAELEDPSAWLARVDSLVTS